MTLLHRINFPALTSPTLAFPTLGKNKKLPNVTTCLCQHAILKVKGVSIVYIYESTCSTYMYQNTPKNGQLREIEPLSLECKDTFCSRLVGKTTSSEITHGLRTEAFSSDLCKSAAHLRINGFPTLLGGRRHLAAANAFTSWSSTLPLFVCTTILNTISLVVLHVPLLSLTCFDLQVAIVKRLRNWSSLRQHDSTFIFFDYRMSAASENSLS